MPLSGVQEREPPKIEKSRPTLSVAPDDVCDGQGLVGIWPVVALEDLQGIRRFDVDRLAQSRGRQIPDSHARTDVRVKLSSSPQVIQGVFKAPLDTLQQLIGPVISVNLNLYVSYFVGEQFIVAEGKACH